MSFHGGLLGVLAATLLFARTRGLAFELTDALAVVTPIGLFFAVANFINAELWGRATDVPWAVVFPTAGPEAAHPSQLYDTGLRGARPVLRDAVVRDSAAPPRCARHAQRHFPDRLCPRPILVELFREPDAQLGFAGGLTMGQPLCRDAGVRDLPRAARPAPGRDPGLSGFEDRLRRLIQEHGPIPVARYMALALAHLTGGYYPRRDLLGMVKISSRHPRSASCSAS